MKKYAILALIAGLFIAQQADAMFGGGASSGEVNLTSSEAQLKAALADAKSKQEEYFGKAEKFVKQFGGFVKLSIEDPLETLSSFSDKFEMNLDKLRDASTANAALDTIGVLLTQGKQLGSKYVEYINILLDEIIRYLATTNMINDLTIKAKLEKTADEISRVIAELKKSFPATIKARSFGDIKQALGEASTALTKGFIEGGTKLGLELGAGLLPSVTQTLMSLITGKAPTQPLTDDEKMQIITNVKQTLVAVEKIKEALNDAASATASDLNKAKNIDTDIVASVKEAFKIFADPTYSLAPNNLKFESLIIASDKLFELISVLGKTLKTVNNAGLKFLVSIYGENGDEGLTKLLSSASKLNKMIDGMNNTFEIIKEEIVNAKNKFAGSTTIGIGTGKPFVSGTTTGTTNISQQSTQQQQPKIEVKAKPDRVWELNGVYVVNPIQGKTYKDIKDNQLVWTWPSGY